MVHVDLMAQWNASQQAIPAVLTHHADRREVTFPTHHMVHLATPTRLPGHMVLTVLKDPAADLTVHARLARQPAKLLLHTVPTALMVHTEHTFLLLLTAQPVIRTCLQNPSIGR